MKLTFLGTRGNTEQKNERHRRHSSLLVSYRNKQVMVDCGEDWLEKVFDINPHAIVLTHAHPDHAWGLKNGAPSRVYATAETLGLIGNYPVDDFREIRQREPEQIENITFEAFGVEHSTRAPAVGYRITAGDVNIFYAPDLVYIYHREEALRNTKLYIGDAATISRSFVRKRNGNLIGHTPIRTQLTWCQKEDVPKAIFTHCGSEIVTGDERSLNAKIREMAEERDVDFEIAHDGMQIILRG
ncbi:MBL fold metallo-hydrolase [candidate division KSB1 bacterium]|nr:MBL fold metallo-hydrolase [candidate division KSB1 bacterium]